MKIEKINDNQIRCTLTQEDLKNQNLHVSELAYGSEKARQLFRDMMSQAYKEVGFNADNFPLMIEAIPDTQNSLVLIITKVEDPEELDTRFSKLSPSSVTADNAGEPLKVEGADDIIDVFRKLRESKKSVKKTQETKSSAPKKTPKMKKPVSLVRLYRFGTIDEVIAAATALGGYYKGSNSLYRNTKTEDYLLVVHQSSHTPEEFNRVCNVLSEYAAGASYSRASEAHLSEHEQTVIRQHALQQLGTLQKPRA